jgi:hypothetical protein
MIWNEKLGKISIGTLLVTVYGFDILFLLVCKW